MPASPIELPRDYQRIEQAIHFLVAHADEQPTLNDVASRLNLTPFHVQRLFVAWAGVSPKEFLQALTLSRAKALLDETRSVLEASLEAGLSGPSRLHDLFLSVECITPGEYKRQGQGMNLYWAVGETPFGDALFARSERGLCHLSFVQQSHPFLEPLKAEWPSASLRESPRRLAAVVAEVGRRMQGLSAKDRLGLVLKGTPLRLKVWQALLRVPYGRALSYSQLAAFSDAPNSVRAVASCVAVNPIAFLVPCHRVIRSTGALGEYHWGRTRKMAMLGREQVQRGAI